jgi:peptide/nickel transport system substrate-binding protein
VKFSDGTPFTAADVVFTYGRAPNVPNSPSSFATYMNQIAKTEAVDDYTIRITTKTPAPTLLENICTVLIVSKKNGEGATTDDYNSGKAAIGTGPYKLVSWALNDNTVLEAKADYWGGKPAWDKVTYRMMQTDAPRVAALLAGDVDVIESVPSQDIDRLNKNPATKVWTGETSRIAYLSLDAGEEALVSGKITGPNGEKLDKNPLADVRVRQALKLGVDLESIVSRIYGGAATPTGQFISTSLASYNPDVKPWKADPVAAKKLLEESGWAGKFKLDLGVSTSVFLNAVDAAQAMAQLWTRIGIPTTVTQVAYPAFLDLRGKRAMPIYLQSFQNASGSAEYLMPTMLHSRQPDRGYGSLNFSRYSNPELDKIIETALSTMDNSARAKLLQSAAPIIAEDSNIIPLWLISEATGTKKTIAFKPRLDRMILPANFSLAN